MFLACCYRLFYFTCWLVLSPFSSFPSFHNVFSRERFWVSQNGERNNYNGIYFIPLILLARLPDFTYWLFLTRFSLFPRCYNIFSRDRFWVNQNREKVKKMLNSYPKCYYRQPDSTCSFIILSFPHFQIFIHYRFWMDQNREPEKEGTVN